MSAFRVSDPCQTLCPVTLQSLTPCPVTLQSLTPFPVTLQTLTLCPVTLQSLTLYPLAERSQSDRQNQTTDHIETVTEDVTTRSRVAPAGGLPLISVTAQNVRQAQTADTNRRGAGTTHTASVHNITGPGENHYTKSQDPVRTITQHHRTR